MATFEALKVKETWLVILRSKHDGLSFAAPVAVGQDEITAGVMAADMNVALEKTLFDTGRLLQIAYEGV